MRENKVSLSLFFKLLFGVIILGGLLLGPIFIDDVFAADGFLVFEKEVFSNGLFHDGPIKDNQEVKIAVLQDDNYVLKPYVITKSLQYKPIDDATFEWSTGSGSDQKVISTDKQYVVNITDVGVYDFICKVTYGGESLSFVYKIFIVTPDDLAKALQVYPTTTTSVPYTGQPTTPIMDVVAELGDEKDPYKYYLKENIDYKVTFSTNPNNIDFTVDDPVEFTLDYIGIFKNVGIQYIANYTIDINYKLKIENTKKAQFNNKATSIQPKVVYYDMDEKPTPVWHYYSDKQCKKELSSAPTKVGTYYIRGSVGEDYSNVCTLTIVPKVAKGFKVKSRNAKTTTLTWTKAEGATGYRIFYRKYGKWIPWKTTTSLSFTMSNSVVASYGQFAVRAYGKNAAGQVIYSDSCGSGASFAYITIRPPRVTIKATKTNKSIKFYWNKSVGATGYRLYVKKNGKWKYLTDTRDTKFYFVGLKSSTAYQFAVRPYTVTVDKKFIVADKYTAITVKTNAK